MEDLEDDIYTTYNINSIKFYQMPKAFFHNPIYMDMKNESKIAYSLLRDLLELSAQNNWINEKNQIYVKLSRKKLMSYLNIKGEQKITQVMKELKDRKLIKEIQLGVNKCNEIYIRMPKELSVIYSDNELLELETVENTLTFENQSSRDVKIKGQELRKSKVKTFENQRHTNTNKTNTEITKICSSSGDIDLYKEFELNICELRKTTKLKFDEVVNKCDKDFILSILEQCSISNIKSYAGFEKVFNSYLKRNCTTRNDVEQATNDYRTNNTKKNKKERGEPKNTKKTNFDNFEPRIEYSDPNYLKNIESKLLGWDK